MATDRREYAAWTKYHAERFGFSEADTALLTHWYEVLGFFAPEQLEEATDELLRSNYPAYARDHLKSLLPSLHASERRRVERQAQQTRTDERGTCTPCGGTGWVCDLPHPQCVRNQEWVYPFSSLAVLCPCPLGAHILLTWKEGRSRPLTFEQYDRLIPKWRSMRTICYERQQAERLALRDAEQPHGTDTALRDAFDVVIARLQAKVDRQYAQE